MVDMKFCFQDVSSISHIYNHMYWRNLFLVVLKLAALYEGNPLLNDLVYCVVNYLARRFFYRSRGGHINSELIFFVFIPGIALCLLIVNLAILNFWTSRNSG
jgi:hypothetical protein